MTGTEWVSVGSLVVAALAVLFGFLDRRQSRSEALRSVMYERQFDAIGAIAEVVGRLERAGVKFYITEDVGIRDQEAQSGLGDVIFELQKAALHHRPVLPARTMKALDRLLLQSQQLLFVDPRIIPGDNTRDLIIQGWSDAVNGLFDEARRDLSVDPLSERIRQLTGAARDERARDMIEDVRRLDAVLSRKSSTGNGDALAPRRPGSGKRPASER